MPKASQSPAKTRSKSKDKSAERKRSKSPNKKADKPKKDNKPKSKSKSANKDKKAKSKEEKKSRAGSPSRSKSKGKGSKVLTKLSKNVAELKSKKDGKKKKAEKDPAKPRGPIRAYFQYTTPGMVELRKPGSDFRNEDGTFKTNPETKEPWKHTELMQVLAGRWGKMTDEEKAPYVKLEEEDKARHEK